MKIIKLVAGLIVVCLNSTVDTHKVSLMSENHIGETKTKLRGRSLNKRFGFHPVGGDFAGILADRKSKSKLKSTTKKK
jgi:hypothetical protein